MIHLNRRAALAGLTGFVAAPALAAFPERPITITHGLAPGGGLDTTARVLAEHLTRRLGQQVLVEPMPGAATLVAARHISRSAPDGYTICLSSASYPTAAALRRSLDFRPVDDFSTISLVTQYPYVIATYREHPVSSLQGLISAARSASQPLLYGTPGTGSSAHLLMALLAGQANIKLQHVPFRGGAQALTELLAKRIDLMIDPPLLFSEHFANGTLRAVAVTSKERSSVLPDTPAISEAGFADFDVRGWMGLVGPGGLPDDIVRRFNSEVAAILADPAVIERFRALGSQARASTPDELRTRIAEEIAKWTAVITEAGIERQ